MIIGETKRDAIDWIQEKLDYARRDVAEETLALLLEYGIAKASDQGILLTEEIPEDELREKSRQAMRAKDARYTRIMRRRSVSTLRSHKQHKKNTKITDLKYIGSDDASDGDEDDGKKV